MASQEQVDLLKECMDTHEGMLKWNKWRKEHLNIYLNLSGVNLNSKSLDGMDLLSLQYFVRIGCDFRGHPRNK